MFSKTRVTEPRQQTTTTSAAAEPAPSAASPAAPAPDRGVEVPLAPTARPRSAPSILSNDLTVVGNIRTQGDIQVEGKVEGDIRAHQLTIGQSATINGEIVADEVIVHGRVVGRVRGLKVRLTASARVEGDIIHKTIAIESGAHFEGSVQRQDDPLANAGAKKLPAPSAE